MKLQGWRSAKGIRATIEAADERFRTRREELQRELEPGSHNALPGERGTIYCCSMRFTPAAHERHLEGERFATSFGGVFATGVDDPWLVAEDARLKAERNEPVTPDEDAMRRAEQVAAYYDQQARGRRKPIRARGTDTWMGED
jgi:hypothetical protein